jgi:hypothetical protein
MKQTTQEPTPRNLRLQIFGISTSHSPSTPLRIGVGLLIILLAGIGLRITQFSHPREFWEDEAILVVEVIQKSPVQITQVLDNSLHFPIGYLLVIKSIVTLLGTSESAFRILSLITGILALIIFVPLARTFDSHEIEYPTDPQSNSSPTPHYWSVILITLLYFAANKHLIYYSSELRAYGVEVFVVCALYLLAIRKNQWERSLLGNVIRNLASRYSRSRTARSRSKPNSSRYLSNSR